MMFWPEHDGSGWGWAAMSISMVVFWALVVIGGVLLVRALNRPSSGSAAPPPPSAEQVLAERFARGEIEEDEYRRRLATLADTARSTTGPRG